MELENDNPVVFEMNPDEKSSHIPSLGRGNKITFEHINVPDRQDLLPKEIARFTKEEIFNNNWKFLAVNELECEIQFNIDFELNVTLLDILMKKFFDLAFKKMVDAFISRAKEIY